MQRSIEHDQIMFSGNYTHSMALVIFSSLDRWHVHSINYSTSVLVVSWKSAFEGRTRFLLVRKICFRIPLG